MQLLTIIVILLFTAVKQFPTVVIITIMCSLQTHLSFQVFLCTFEHITTVIYAYLHICILLTSQDSALHLSLE